MAPQLMLVIVSGLCVLSSFVFSTHSTRDDVINKLLTAIEHEQQAETHPRKGVFEPDSLEGLYNGFVGFNFRGDCDQSFLRRHLRVPTISTFVDSVVAKQILDAFLFGNTPKPSDGQIERTVKMFSNLHNKNHKYKTSEVTYFDQKYNPKTHRWFQGPEVSGMKTAKKFNLPTEYLTKALFGEKPLPRGMEDIFSVDHLMERLRPALDTDTINSHLLFGSRLYSVRDKFPVAWDRWIADNSNFTGLWDVYRQYAYRPFSKNTDEALIDPKSYYHMRHFLDKAMKEGRDLAIVSSYVQNLENQKLDSETGNLMPFGVNAIDFQGVAKFLAVFISVITSGMEKAENVQNPDFILLLESSYSYLLFYLRNDMEGRPDLAMPYYSSLYDTYWVVATGLMYMENSKRSGKPLPMKELENYYSELSDVMRGHVTRVILADKNVDAHGNVYYDDFLGNSDISFYGEPINRAEDRIFTTAVASNSLLFSWSFFDCNGDLRWHESTPTQVKDVVKGCANWLEKHTLGGQYQANAVWGASILKGREGLPYWYPANTFKYMNGTTIQGFTHVPADVTIFGMQGYVDSNIYGEMLEVEQFGEPTPHTFNGYNNVQGAIIYYSCPAIAYSSALTTLSMTGFIHD